jgi:hypothetical protein
MNRTAKFVSIFILSASTCAFAQQVPDVVISQAQQVPDIAVSQSGGSGGQVSVRVAGFGGGPGAVVQGQPYSATITNESVETLADGNRIVQNGTGTIARDSQGRTRRDMSMPPIGNLSAANAPHIVMIEDPVAQAVYTLNLTDKTAQKMPTPPMPPGARAAAAPDGGDVFYMQTSRATAGAAALPPPPMINKEIFLAKEQGSGTTEDLGSQTMEGVFVTGVRTTRTIPAGQIGNEKPISVVTEVWTSPDLKTIVYSKRDDPRMGEQTFKLTTISRSEPDPSLFTVPSDFQIVEGPKPIIYRTNQ